MPDRPRVLMLTPYLPTPPESGGRRRTIELLARLRSELDVTLACLARPRERAADLTELRELCDVHVVERPESPGLLAAGWKALTSPEPLTVQLYRSAELRRLSSSLAEATRFAAIHVESFYMLQNVPQELRDRVVLVEPDVESVAWRRYAKVARPFAARPVVGLEARKLRLFETAAWRGARLVGLVSEIDRARVASRAPGVETFLAPNGVGPRFLRTPRRPRLSDTAAFIGDFKYFPNVDAAVFFVGSVLPRVLARRPDFRLQLAGKDPPARVRALGRSPAVEVLGRVDEPADLLGRASIFVCPIRAGSGTRLKILEAMASGAAVVSTSLGCEGLAVEPGRHLLVADTPEAIADRVLALLERPAAAEAMGREARAWVERHASWEEPARALGEAYERAASAASRGSTSRGQS